MSETAEKKYELRELNSTDIFAISRIIKKIGVANFKNCFASDNVKKLLSGLSDEEKKSDKALTGVGMEVAFELADILFSRLPECETELYTFLSSVSGLKIPEIQKLTPAEFFEMIIEVISKPEFKDFLKVASRLFN